MKLKTSTIASLSILLVSSLLAPSQAIAVQKGREVRNVAYVVESSFCGIYIEEAGSSRRPLLDVVLGSSGTPRSSPDFVRLKPLTQICQSFTMASNRPTPYRLHEPVPLAITARISRSPRSSIMILCPMRVTPTPVNSSDEVTIARFCEL
jgi:hypothetical protein